MKLISTPASTREKLINAAAGEFNSAAYEATNSNKIARAADYAPQTFYRHFKDKTDIFIQVYRHWESLESQALSKALESAGDRQSKATEAAAIVMKHHRDWAQFRQSLRSLTSNDQRVRTVRNKTRRQQAGKLPHLEFAQAMALVLIVESLCDAYADKIISDLKIPQKVWKQRVAEAILPAIR